jgi:integrase/recombinase XerD
MIETLFEAPHSSRHRRVGLIAPHFGAFTAWLATRGYTPNSIRLLVSGARTFTRWIHARGSVVEDVDDRMAECFVKKATCAESHRKTLRQSVRHMLAFLRDESVIALAPEVLPTADLAVVVEFREWMREHRGVQSSTFDLYVPIVRDLLHELRGDVARITARLLRDFVVARAGQHSRKRACTIVSALRMFVRFLAASAKCPTALVAAVPSVASWRETSVPRHLSPCDVERVVSSCDVTMLDGLRDRAVLLLLARLGLRAGDVASLTLDAFDWKCARLRVAGKGRREDWLPLPQDVGDAVLAYIKKARPRIRAAAVFFTAIAPIVPLQSWVVSQIVGRAIRRSGVSSPSHGAHVLRHSAAVRMLRAGSSLTEIGALLRHASIETTFHYAKVDRDLLLEIAMPWPGVAS